MDKIYTVLSVLLVISEIISANVESNEKLTLRIEDHITSENCNQTLMNIQVCFSKNCSYFVLSKSQLKIVQ